MWTRIRTGVLTLLLTAAGFAVSMVLFRDVHPLGGLRIRTGRERITAIGSAIADSLGASRPGYVVTANIARSQNIVRQVHERFGVREGNAMLRSTIPAFTWQLTWEKPDETNLTFRSGGSTRDQMREIAAVFSGKLEMELDLDGHLTRLEIPLPDSLNLPSLTAAEARGLADAFLGRYAPALLRYPDFQFSGQKAIQLPQRSDYEFTWTGTDTLLRDPLTVKVRVDGTRIAGLLVSRAVPAESQGTGESPFLNALVVILVAVLIITMIVVGLKRVRSYEIGWRAGVFLGIASAALLATEILFTVPSGLNASFFAALLLGPFFFGGALALSWSIAESVGREAWKEKFTTIDLLMKGHFLDSRVARSALAGIATGAVANAVWLLGASVLTHTMPVWFNSGDDITLKYLPYLSPGVFLLAHMASLQLFMISALCVFPLAFLRRWISSTPILVGIVAFVVPLMGTTTTHPLPAGHIIDTLSIAVIVWSLTRFDVLTAYFGFLAAATFDTLPLMLSAGDPAIFLSGEIVLALGCVSLVLGWVGLATKDRITDTEAIVPAFARHISERERLQHELLIARDVQMNLLPKATPRVPGLDIASRCDPALEVGGDYYDFVLPGAGRLGVVVGDVSGKGIEGAFYMTLTKGFLKAIARASDSPASVLVQANSLFYDNVERGTFISIIYGLIDPAAGTVTIARAGHNPPVLSRRDVPDPEVIQPKGIALGLEPGDRFGGLIEELTLPFRTGDSLIFYTDGFVESTNPSGEQFGDDRLMASVKRLSGLSAMDTLEGILADVHAFAGKATQHDDMTIVVVRRTETG
ncbi:MAG TPA: PP2C family protein-serine/threonine phosphatase [Bacteroidota bacterium]|nr:PP2C family protein-serine/threonine phosphatase [Bacteroidota bacterium]